VVDTMDCINAARYLADQGEVDGDRLLIRGGSAGGYTTLCALTFHDDFAAGASYYGISDLEPFAKPGGTHKFESRYEHTLVGPYPEAAELYHARSPIHYVDMISCPMILLQGSEDEVVPPSQSEVMVDALKAKGLPYAYLLFEGEQHGFRKAENIIRSLEAELSFYAQILGFEPGDPIEPVTIANLREGVAGAGRSTQADEALQRVRHPRGHSGGRAGGDRSPDAERRRCGGYPGGGGEGHGRRSRRATQEEGRGEEEVARIARW